MSGDGDDEPEHEERHGTTRSEDRDRDDVDPIIEAGDDGEVLDRSADGAVECVADGDGMTVRVHPDSELGERLAWHAGHRGETPDALLDEAIREHLDDRRERADGGDYPREVWPKHTLPTRDD